MTRILGIDPGSRITGFGVIDFTRGEARYLSSGCIRIKGDDLGEKLKIIYDGVTEIVQTHTPEVLAVEQVFMHRNAASALKLGQARGAAVVAGVVQSLPVYEYTPTQVKLAIVGKGHAAKDQVQHMVRVLLGLSASPASDAADALAVALCHAHNQQTLGRIAQARGIARGSSR
jgi:crossover junction endodeoxyribonuclease RuvC